MDIGDFGEKVNFCGVGPDSVTCTKLSEQLSHSLPLTRLKDMMIGNIIIKTVNAPKELSKLIRFSKAHLYFAN